MPAPDATGFLAPFTIGSSYVLRIIGTNISSPASVTISESNTGVAWTVSSWSYDGTYLDVSASLASTSPPTGPPGGLIPYSGSGGDGCLTIIITNPPDTPGNPPIPDATPLLIPAYYATSY